MPPMIVILIIVLIVVGVLHAVMGVIDAEVRLGEAGVAYQVAVPFGELIRRDRYLFPGVPQCAGGAQGAASIRLGDVLQK